MLVDIHSHLLPGVDDGAIDAADAIELAKAALADGIQHAIVTPHHRNGFYINKKADILTSVSQLRAIYEEAGVALTIHPGQEIRMTEELLEDLYNDNLLSLDEAGKYYLIEFPTTRIPSYSMAMIEELISQGITPVIAHPERNEVFKNDYHLLYQYIEAGCLSQITTSSYVGKYGVSLKDTAREMIEYRLAHVLATDAHNQDYRPHNLNEAYTQLEADFSSQQVKEFQATAQAILEGKTIEKLSAIEPPQPKRPPFWHKWFKS